MGLKEVEKLCGRIVLTPSSSSVQTAQQVYEKKETKKSLVKRCFDEECENLFITNEYVSEEMGEICGKVDGKITNSEPDGSDILNHEAHLRLKHQIVESSESEVFTISPLLSSSSDALDEEKLESHFIDVGSLTFGGIFGLGEEMDQRVVMARTTVQCLTLPRFFLLEKAQNPSNIWQRRLFYLNCTVPSKEALFADFLKNRNWQKFKHNFIHKNLKSNVNDISQEDDIPIICRIVEAAEY